MTLYLKYRPQNLDELDLVSVRDSLKKIVASKNIPHAFLFSGPKGAGKTSAARILAKILNCEGKNPPCNKCVQCVSIMNGNNLDVIELDGASHRGIDDIRSLRDAVKLSPTSARKKVYIIDEAHMLTTEASNALLKTLEEPPSHVVFILATTNPEKLIETIHSRALNINFSKATDEEIVNSLLRIVRGEKIKVDKKVLDLIAKASGGAFRDAAKIFEQILSEKIKLDDTTVSEFLFKHKGFNVEEFIGLLSEKDTQKLLILVQDSIKKGNSAENILSQILSVLRTGLLAEIGIGEGNLEEFTKEELIYLIELLNQSSQMIANSLIEELPLEIAIIKWCGEGEKKEEVKLELEEKKTIVLEKGSVGSFDESLWREILTSIKPINASIEALLRASKPMEYDGKTLTLGVFYKFHKERLEDGHHRRILEEVVTEVLKSPTRVVCILTEPPFKIITEEPLEKPILTESEDEDIIKVAEEIFGS